MSIKKLFDKNKKENSIAKYLKKSSADNLGSGMESSAHLKASVEKNEDFIPYVDYADPKEFAKFGSAEKYYDNAFSHVVSNYPYDGSKLEKVDFYNNMNPLEKWIFENKYPTSKGYVILGNTYGSVTSGSSGYFSSSKEYIEVKGGPHATTLYSTGSNRTNNLEFGGVSGSTIEFFYKKELGTPHGETQSEKQVIFDVHNGYASGSSGYGRMRVEIFSGSEDRFRVTMMSGATGFVTQSVPTTGGLNTTNDIWDYYSFVFNTSGSVPTIDFYVNGSCWESNISASDASMPSRHAGRIDLVTGSLIGNIGALVAAPSGTSPHASRVVNKGYGKLSASLDEFRYWKKARSSEEVGRYWLAPVNGGADKYDANVSLGVYLKFNEGITGVPATDKVVLDYSGRISNGTWRGYETSGIRNTGSALDQLQKDSVSEIGDPIVRLPNSAYSTVKNSLTEDGRQYDYTNTAYLMNSVPSWVAEEDEDSTQELKNITQVMANYFDTLHLQISELSKIKDMRYLSGSSTGSINEFPHNDRLVENLGLETSDLFADAGILENYFKRDEQINFEQDIVSIKNTIYRNIYNNLNYILKSKGNEKSIRNLIRCFGIDEGIISLNTYGVNSSYKLESQYKAGVSNKKYIDFSGLNDRPSVSGTVFQVYNSDISGSWGVIAGYSGSADLHEFGFTAECEVVFPSFKNAENLTYDLVPVITSSLFGFHSPASGSGNIGQNTDTTVTVRQDYNWGLQVRAIKAPAPFSEISSPLEKVRDAYFVVQNTQGVVLLSSDIFYNVYDNQKWNFSIGVSPTKYQYATGVTGSYIDNADIPAENGYELSFYGVNYDTGIKRNSFRATKSVGYVSGSRISAGAKRFFLGAHKTNFTGALLAHSDIRASSLRYWTDVLPTGTIDLHAREVDTFGRQKPSREAYEFQARNPGVHIPRIETLALNWDFADVTGSNTSGQFEVLDRSSGSAADLYENQYQGTFSNITLRQHPGKGQDFAPSSTPAQKQYVYKEEIQLPEYASSTDMVSVVASDNNVFTPAARPTDYFYALEKSMYGNISKTMLQLFASIDEMNNLIGEPVNLYRPNYKNMEKLRQLFFNKVGNSPDLEKYLDFYKWIDASIGNIVEQLYPASFPHATGVRNVVESHLLERPKYKYTFLGDRKSTFPPGGEAARGTMGSQPLIRSGLEQRSIGNLGGLVNYVETRAPLPQSPQKENENSIWWKYKAERTNPTISSSVPGVNFAREQIVNALRSEITSSKVVSIGGSVYKSQGIGQNPGTLKYSTIKDITFGKFAAFKDTTDDPDPKVKRKTIFEATNDSETYNGELLVPFTAYSSSVESGYVADLRAYGLTGTIITNLHERPESLQGPFTRAHVGGIQARHNAPLMTTGRKEQFSLLLDGGFAIATITISIGGGGFATSNYNGKNVTLSLGGVDFDTDIDNTADMDESTATTTGVQNATSVTNVASALVTSINASAATQNLPVTAYNLGSIIIVTTTSGILGPLANGTSFAGSLIASAFGSTSAFTGGKLLEGAINSISGDNPRGQYRRTLGASSPINIANIRTNLQNLTGSVTGGVNPIGNFTRNYEILQTSDRNSANADFLFNNNLYYKGGIPTAFVSAIGMRSLGRTGSVDYYNPRQRGPLGKAVDEHSGSLRTTKSVITSRFSAPGGKLDSKQQFRDISSDQYSPNNALPFRNIDTRSPYTRELAGHVSWGGFSGSSGLIMSTFTPMAINNTEQFGGGVAGFSSGNPQVALDLLNEGVQQFGYPSASLEIRSATQAEDGMNLQFVTPDGDTYEANTDETLSPASSNATDIGTQGIQASGLTDLAQAISISLTAWVASLSNPFKYSVVSPVSFSDASGDVASVGIRRNDFDTQIVGTAFGSSFVDDNAGITSIPTEVNPKFIAKAAVHKTQRNGTSRLVIAGTDHKGSGDQNNEIYRSNSFQFDNAFVSRPIPQADRSSWFLSMVSGSTPQTNTYQQYLISGSRYPGDIYNLTSSAGLIEGAKASNAVIAINSLVVSQWNGRTLDVFDALGNQLQLTASTSIALDAFSRASAGKYSWGVGGSNPANAGLIRNSLQAVLNEAASRGETAFTNTGTEMDFGGGNIPVVTLTQSANGPVSTFLGTARPETSPIVAFVQSPEGGAATIQPAFGQSVFSNSSGISNYQWVDNKPVAPWTQIRTGELQRARYLNKNNIYQFSPVEVVQQTIPLSLRPQDAVQPWTKAYSNSTKYEYYTDRFTNRITSSFSQRYVEPPVTSRYKPLVHQIQTVRGTAAETKYDEKTDITLAYSYGNVLQSFANKEINIKLGNKASYMSGEIRRPYEVLRDNFTEKVQRNTTGAELIKMMAYSETIFPREINTYLSGTRQRLAFTQDYWRNDTSGTAAAATQIEGVTLPTALTIQQGSRPSFYEYDFAPFDPTSDTAPAIDYLRQGNSQRNRLVSYFTTSMGYPVRFDEQAPVQYEFLANAPGTGSMWPLDSHIFAELPDAYLERPFSGSKSNATIAGINVLASAFSTHGAGELMMTHYGRVLSGSQNKLGKERDMIPGTSSLNSCQYVYNVPTLISGTKTVYLGNPALKPDTFATLLTHRAPGGGITLPAWTAHKERRYVDGPSRAKAAPPRTPTYESYEEYAQDVRLKGQDHSIIPEFRISNQLPNYVEFASINSLVTASIELTGASETIYDGTNDAFMPRYGTTDVLEYLQPFMGENTDDGEFNKPPRHFKMESEAVLKLLPYDGFYPVNRTLQIATLFSQSYAPFSKFYSGHDPGNSTNPHSSSVPPSRWRTLSRPFFAPGILYNSIKSGIGIEFPIRRESFVGSEVASNVARHVEGRFRLSDDQYLTSSAILSSAAGELTASNYFSPLHGCLSGALDTLVQGATNRPGFGPPAPGQIPGNRRRRKEGGETNFDWVNAPDTQRMFWADTVPFEGILNPLDHIGISKTRLVNIDFNDNLYIAVSGAVELTNETRLDPDGTTVRTFSDSLYKMSISNFLANVPKFFLKKKKEGGYLTKFVANVPARASKNDPAGVSKTSQVEPNKISVSSNRAYIMEVGLKKTDNFNLYNNPYAFGPPTSTGSYGWDTAAASNNAKPITTGTFGTIEGAYPQGKPWPLHRGEFAPFTPTYYYGPSLVRVIYTPSSNKEVTLGEILSSNEISVEYLNSNGYFYDFDSGSFADQQNQQMDTSGIPFYHWNRAWQNRQDIDASIIIDNLFPSEAGAKIKPLDPNKWVIMPKWECPVLDISGTVQGMAVDPTGNPYNFSSSVNPGEFYTETKGMWHQYGLMPKDNEGVYLYISEINDESTEYRLVGNPTGSGGGSFSTATGQVKLAKKVPLSVVNSGREIASLATLVGFDEKEIMSPNEWDPSKAKRIGELAEDGEKTISEAILAIPYYYDSETDKVRAMMLQAPEDTLGPKIKEFRQAFTKYSFPPSLRKSLVDLLPPNYPKVPDFINPFGGDDYDSLLSSESSVNAPVVYLMEHSVEFSRQDLADIWQNIMPDIGSAMKTSVTAIDHYMPGENVEKVETVFPEILRKEIELGIPRSGHPRPDLLDTSVMGIEDGFQPEIRWMVFKVKERGQTDFTSMMIEEINDGPGSLSFENMFGYVADDLPPEQRRYLMDRKNIYTKGLYHVDEIGRGRNTFNWPYDYCSLIESAKLTTKVGFRPELEREVEDFDEQKVKPLKSKSPQPNIDIDNIEADKILAPNLQIMQSLIFAPPPIAPPSPPISEQLSLVPNVNTPVIPIVTPQNIPTNLEVVSPVNVASQNISPRINLAPIRIPNVTFGGNNNGGGNNFGGGGFGGGGNFGGY